MICTRIATVTETTELITNAIQVGMLSMWSTERKRNQFLSNYYHTMINLTLLTNITFWSIVDDAEQINKQRDAIENRQRPQARFQRVFSLQYKAIDQHEKTDTHSTA